MFAVGYSVNGRHAQSPDLVVPICGGVASTC